MKFLVVLAVLVGVAAAGVVELTQQQEWEIIDMYNRICGHGDPQEPVAEEGRWVFCKTDRAGPPINHEHTAEVAIPAPKPITVLINRPPRLHNHKINVNGVHPGQDTKIYVLPQEDAHNVDVEANVVSQKQKPLVHFIKEGGRLPVVPLATPGVRAVTPHVHGPAVRAVPLRLQPVVRTAAPRYPAYHPHFAASEYDGVAAEAPAEVAAAHAAEAKERDPIRR